MVYSICYIWNTVVVFRINVIYWLNLRTKSACGCRTMTRIFSHCLQTQIHIQRFTLISFIIYFHCLQFVYNLFSLSFFHLALVWSFFFFIYFCCFCFCLKNTKNKIEYNTVQKHWIFWWGVMFHIFCKWNLHFRLYDIRSICFMKYFKFHWNS